MDHHSQGPRPLGICAECQTVGAGRTHKASRKLFLFCPHNRTGGVLERTEDGTMWHLFSPVTREAFEAQMHLYADRYAELNGAPPAPLN
jgi:hypothetical protein